MIPQVSPFTVYVTGTPKAASRHRRGRALATLVVAVAIGLVTTYLILQAQFNSTPDESNSQVSALSNPQTETYGAEASATPSTPSTPSKSPTVTANKPPVESPVPTPAPGVSAEPSPVGGNEESDSNALDAESGSDGDLSSAQGPTPALPKIGPPEGADGDVVALSPEDRESSILSRRPAVEDAHALRDWTLTNGARAEAAFVAVDQEMVVLRDVNGRDHKIALSRLSDGDREFIDAVARLSQGD